MNDLVVGIDCGSQSAKVGIFDTDGNVRGWGQRQLRPTHRPAPGVVVHPDDDVWDSIVAACADAVSALRAGGGDPGEITAVGVCTIRCCKAFLDDAGDLTEPMISWMDDRAYRPYRSPHPDTR
jgi:sugar (pentulose or hexulose) kinase